MASQILRTSTRKRASTSRAYQERVNLAIDYVLQHLAEPLRLSDIACAAHFSPFHFHRVFQAMTGQTLADFVRHKRLERALLKMAHAPRMKLTQIALECGFGSSADFSRSFKQHFGAAPSAFDVAKWRRKHAGELESRTLITKPSPRSDHFKVRIRSLPPRTVAYIRVENPYGGTGVVDACNRLVAWAERSGLADGQWLGYQWENPELVALENCAYYVAVEADRFKPEGDIGRFRFPAMTVAQVDLRGDIQLELRALQWLYGHWLPRSGYIPDDQPGFEAWVGRPFAQGYEYFELAAQIPIRKFT